MAIADKTLSRIVGQDIRVLREKLGWTRQELADRLPSGIGERTVLSYEHGIRALSLDRFVEICRVLKAPPAIVLDGSLVKAGDMSGMDLVVNVAAILKDRTAGYKTVRNWVKKYHDEDPSRLLSLSSQTIGALATSFDLSHQELAAYLHGFTATVLTQDLRLKGKS